MAEQRVPSATLHVGDMTSFDLHRRFDAVICMFSAIGYAREVERLTAAVKAMASHLEPGGIFILEPWLFPDVFQEGLSDVLKARAGNLEIERTSSSRREGSLSIVEFRYEVRPEGGGPAESSSEDHVLGLFSDDDYRKAIGEAGLELLAFDPKDPTDRGLYVANNPSTGSGGL